MYYKKASSSDGQTQVELAKCGAKILPENVSDAQYLNQGIKVDICMTAKGYVGKNPYLASNACKILKEKRGVSSLACLYWAQKEKLI